MCLFSKLIRNPKYTSNQKNKGVVPIATDERVLKVPIGCGYCMECMRKKRNEWKTRLKEEIKTEKNGKFTTLTFSNESYTELAKEIKEKTTWNIQGYNLDNKIAKLGVRRFLERWRKKHGKSIKHWLVTEIGQKGTENIHLHGILWTNEEEEEIQEKWLYGFIKIGKKDINENKINYVNEQTINYIAKYITKTDLLHKYYKPIILTSPGIGKGYTNSYNFERNLYKGKETEDTYRGENGFKTALPIYYRNKAYSEEEREMLWLNKLDKNERWVGGEKCKADDENTYEKLLEWYRQINRELGYAEPNNYDAIKYEHERRLLNQKRRFACGAVTKENTKSVPKKKQKINNKKLDNTKKK